MDSDNSVHHIFTRPALNFITGFFYPWRAARFILKNPTLYKYILLPLLINLIVFSLVIFWGLTFYGDLIGRYIPESHAWYMLFLNFILWILAIALAAILIFFSFTVLGNLVASPFNEILSAKTEEILTGAPPNSDPFIMSDFLKESAGIFFDEARKMVLFVGCMILLLLLNLVPLVGMVLYGGLSFMLTVFFMVVEYTGYVFPRQKLSFKDQRHFILARKQLCAGFGCGTFLLTAIPFVQFFSIPVGVVGATLLYHETSPD